jgi:hypothetical protein
MRPLPDTPEIRDLARRVVWFKPPSDAIAMPAHLIAHVLTYGTHEDVSVLRRFVSDDELRAALASAPPGIFDSRSWAYWHLKLGPYPAPPLPSRMFGPAARPTGDAGRW